MFVSFSNTKHSHSIVQIPIQYIDVTWIGQSNVGFFPSFTPCLQDQTYELTGIK